MRGSLMRGFPAAEETAWPSLGFLWSYFSRKDDRVAPQFRSLRGAQVSTTVLALCPPPLPPPPQTLSFNSARLLSLPAWCPVARLLEASLKGFLVLKSPSLPPAPLSRLLLSLQSPRGTEMGGKITCSHWDARRRDCSEFCVLLDPSVVSTVSMFRFNNGGRGLKSYNLNAK